MLTPDPASELAALIDALDAATGRDLDLDERLRVAFGDAASSTYTSSVDDCLALVRQGLPDWSWHVGWSGDGISPYATLHKDDVLIQRVAPTVPLALLRAFCRAMVAERAS